MPYDIDVQDKDFGDVVVVKKDGRELEAFPSDDTSVQQAIEEAKDFISRRKSQEQDDEDDFLEPLTGDLF